MGFYAKSMGYYGKNMGFYDFSFFSVPFFFRKYLNLLKICKESIDIAPVMNFEGL